MSAIMPDPVDASRLVSSLVVLMPRLDMIAAEFCNLLEYAVPTLRLKLPSDERVIAVAIEEILDLARHPSRAPEVATRYAEMALERGIEETDLPVLLASFQTALAETAGYTWTDALEDTWSIWLDTLTELALEGVGAPNSTRAA